VPHLDLDSIAWESPAVRRGFEATVALLEDFVAKNPGWVIEGCYGDLAGAAARHCTELRFLNPGVDACVSNCLKRGWEPSKFETKEKQDAMLEFLVGWVRQYETRGDEYGLASHRAVFEAFEGTKREYRDAPRE
ncbi:MAG TPA: hypothetical protein VGI39_18070, partial [Polyangiaceae bacterium]